MDLYKTKVVLLVALFTAIIAVALSQKAEPYTSPGICNSQLNCSACIQTPSCAWCFIPDKDYSGPRCFRPSESTTCPEEYIIDPDTNMTVISNMALSKARHSQAAGGGHWGTGYEGNYSYSENWDQQGSSASKQGHQVTYEDGRIVQVAPQRISLQLRPGQSYSITMGYTQAEDYPVDLYYLMDLSKSMSDDKEKLSILGDTLAETMQNMTSNFTLGFGSFVDKVVMPYVSTIPENLKHPCEYCTSVHEIINGINQTTERCEYCAAPYGYRNMLSLSANTYRFSHMVREASVSGNLDGPEGGFDAIMQAVVCRDHIGWREQARRLLVFSTDASFHFAGDGKLGGIVKPNDGMCHLSRKGDYVEYSESLNQDYPSIEQINLAVKKNSINVIFAVTSNTIEIYEQLAKHIEGASAAILKEDSSNVVDLIVKQYEQISSSVEMKHNASSAVSIRFFSKCLDKDGRLTNTNKCGGIKVGDVVEFRVDLEVLKCPQDPKDRFETIKIYPVGINESLIIDLEMICECDCEKPSHKFYQVNSPICRNVGTYMCGVCVCNPGVSGKFCDCNEYEKQSSKGCIPANSTIECYGRGKCNCGRCECDRKDFVYGEFCQCDNTSCERHNKEICSGPDNGYCKCGTCICKPGWTGPSCACKVSQDSCYDKSVKNGTLCSGHGECKCGVCECEANFTGQFCQKCPNCPNKCDEFKDCVECQQYHTGKLADVCTQACGNVTVPLEKDKVEVINEDIDILCRYTDDDENHCRWAFVYNYDTQGELHITAQKKKECPPKVFVLGIVFGVIAAIVLIGMAILLLWKLLTSIHDRREFAKFEKERMMAKWDTGENPIYKQATSTFKNPTYAGKG